jgi:outer membrane autotransporter protein
MGLPVAANAGFTSYTLMANLYYDIDTGTAFTPYVGGGVGAAIHDLGKVTYSFAGAPVTETGKTTTRFAWALGAGTAYTLTSNIKLDVAYQYLNAGKFKTGGMTDDGPVPPSSGKVAAHEVKFGMRYSF